ncbi:hypothetical protein G9A89_008347 [Geosiphon pyriformis]|nr:hypothetical protein G9A89_008347 [Geosiphon pyriformis]
MQQQYQQPLPIQPYQIPPTQQYQVPARRLVQHNQFTPQNQLQNNHNRINPNNHNAAVNEQKAITVMYTEATVEGKPIHLILDSGLARSIITYQLMQQLKRNVDRPAQTVIVTADRQYTIVLATCSTFNKRLEKAPVFEFEEEKEMPLIETYMALGSTFNWAEETEQEIFEESRRWKKVRYSTPEPQKQPPYIPLKCKDCNKKLSSMGAYVRQMKEAKYIEYTIELAGFDYEDEVETYHQIASHTYSTQKA